MKRTIAFFLWFAFVATASAAERPKSLFYVTSDPSAIRSFLAHADKVDLLVPTFYSVNAEGLVTGAPNPVVMDAAKKAHVPVMPIVVNGGFVQAEFHKFVGDTAAQKRMLDALIRACKENGYIGIQFDFENVRWTDRDALSALVKDSAAAFHKESLQLSVATVPNAPGGPGSETQFSAWIYENWRGAYDLKAIGEAVDLLCLMTYDQNTLWTVPGPVSGWNWVVANVDYALQVVPPEKLSLGIPLYGYHWFAGMPVKDTSELGYKANPTASYISYRDAMDLARTYGAKVEWD